MGNSGKLNLFSIINAIFFVINILENLKVCDKKDDFLKYTTIVTSEIFKKKIENQCEIPNCHTKRYNSFEFLDNFEVGNNTGPIIEHGYFIQANEVNKL